MRKAEVAEACIAAKNASFFNRDLPQTGGANQASNGAVSGRGGYDPRQSRTGQGGQQSPQGANDVQNKLFGDVAIGLARQPKPEWHQNFTNALNSFFGNPSSSGQFQALNLLQPELVQANTLSLLNCDPQNVEFLAPEIAVMNRFGVQNTADAIDLAIFWYRLNNQWLPFHIDDDTRVKENNNCRPGGWTGDHC